VFVDRNSTKNDGKRILLVEDFEDSRYSLSRLLEIEGYEVIEASNGVQAVDLALNSRPDLILMDLSLPVVDGLSASKEIRRHESTMNVPIVALSGHDVTDLHGEAEAAGCTDYITKPVDFDALMSLIAKYV
jgi:two-component system cell cycle response regulator DivK